MDTTVVILIIASLTLISIITFLILYFKNEKNNRQIEQDNLEVLKSGLTELKNLSINTASDITNRFNDLRKEVKLSQDQANTKMNSGFENLEEENKKIRKEIADNITKLQSAFKDYAEKADKLLTKYSNDVDENKKETNQLKEQIQQQLQNILKEIKSPLDLD